MNNSFLLALSGMFLLLALLFAGEQVPAKTDSPNEWKIVFTSYRDRNNEICVMDLDGKNQKNLTRNPARDENPYWSPDKKKIIFESDRDGNYEIYSMNPDGTGLKNLTRNKHDDELRGLGMSTYPFSPDGKKILFRSSRKKYGLYTMNADGTEPKWLILGVEGAWSPDGEWIAYSCRIPVPQRPSDENRAIFVIRKDGTGKRRVTPVIQNAVNGESDDFGASFSPNGQLILFQSTRGRKSERSSEPCHVYLINVNGTGFRQLTRGYCNDYQAKFLDNERIIFTSDRSTESPEKARGEGRHLFITNIKTGATKPINPVLPGRVFLQYIAAKKKILINLVLRDQDNEDNEEIFVMDEDGRNAKNLTNHAGYDGRFHF